MDKWLGRLSCWLGRHHWEVSGRTFTRLVYACRRCHALKETDT